MSMPCLVRHPRENFLYVFKCATRRGFAGWRWKTFDALAIVVAGVKLAAA